VSEWAIQVPHRSRDESLVDVAGHARHLETDEDRQVCRQLVISARLDGVATTAGELLDHLDGLDPHERRTLVDRARAECGLASTEEVDSDRRADAMFRPGKGFAVQRCAIADCTNMPTNGLGAIVEVDARRWHCSVHEHLAGPEDMQPHGSGLRYTEGGVMVPIDPADDARERARMESEAADREARYEERTVDVAARADREAGKREQLARELPDHLKETVA
jgi:hypothetical protein